MPRSRLARIRNRITVGVVVAGLAAYSIVQVSLVSYVVVFIQGDPHDSAVIFMMLGMLTLWVVVGAPLTYRYRQPVAARVRRVPLDWRVTFVLFATVLALLHEVITVSMTNLAPVFGSEIGEAYITASTNYFEVVLFHSVVMFVPMFIVWAWLLSRWAFTPGEVFLLYGVTGLIAEIGMDPTNALGGFWIFVYGLFVYLPAYAAMPHVEGPPPNWRHRLLAIVLPFLVALPWAGVVVFMRGVFGIEFFDGV